MHLKTVLRLRTGDTINIFNNDGEFSAQITSVDKTRTTFEILEKFGGINEPACRITLYQAVPKSDKLELIVQKCTEIGVCSFVPFESSRCVGKLNPHKIERLNKICYEAVKQSRRQFVPTVNAPISFDELLQRIPTHELCICAWEQSHSALKSILSERLSDIAIIIGGEGGFCAEEAQAMNSAGARLATLGKRILRTETAGIVLSSIILYEMNDII